MPLSLMPPVNLELITSASDDSKTLNNRDYHSPNKSGNELKKSTLSLWPVGHQSMTFGLFP